MSESKEITNSRYENRILTRDDRPLIESFYRKSSANDRSIVLYLDRSPGVWQALSVEGRTSDILAVVDLDLNRIAGAMICSQKKAFVSGKIINMGYVSSLKVDEDYQGSVVLARLFKLFREYCDEEKPPCWLFSVFENNRKAINVFKKKNRILPIFLPVQESMTYILRKRLLPVHRGINGEINIRNAESKDVKKILRFMVDEGKNKTFLPNYNEEEIHRGVGLLNGFRLSDLMVAEDINGICGLMGLWNQHDFRRWKVESYSQWIKILRPLINICCSVVKMPTLPALGKEVPYKVLSLILVRDNKMDLFKRLFNGLMKNERQGNHLYSITLLKNNSLNLYFKSRSVKMANRIYIGYWPEHEAMVNKLDLENIYIEQGAL